MVRNSIARDQNDQGVQQFACKRLYGGDFDKAWKEVDPAKQSDGEELGQPAKPIEVLMDEVAVESVPLVVGGFPVGDRHGGFVRDAGSAQRSRW